MAVRGGGGDKARLPRLVLRKAARTGDRSAELQTRKAKDTFGRLVVAAGVVFGRRGFLASRVADIVREAKVSHGTFYTYFDSKEQIFQAAAQRTVSELYAATRGSHDPNQDPVERINIANRRYLEAYKSHAPMLAVIEQVGTLTPGFRKIRRELRRTFIDRAERGIRRLQDLGLADPLLDPAYAAYALGSMVDHSAYQWLVIGESLDEELLLSTLTRIWAKGIGLDVDGAGRKAVESGPGAAAV
jgi:AcrR family transcriptional regulator